MRVILVTTGKETGVAVLKTTASTDSPEAEGAEAEVTASAHPWGATTWANHPWRGAERTGN